jgi:hypothetical protein
VLIPDELAQAIAAGAGAFFFGLFLITLGLFIVKLESRISARRAQRDQLARDLELAGLKASHTDPRREIVV